MRWKGHNLTSPKCVLEPVDIRWLKEGSSVLFHTCVFVFCVGVRTGLTLREEHVLWVFRNRVLRKTSGAKEEVTGDWRKLHNEELHDLHSSSSIIRVRKSRRMRWAGHLTRG
jgi:hypothetical protein